MTNADPIVVEYLSGVVGVVDATFLERRMLWLENERLESPMAWRDTGNGHGQIVGNIDGMDVSICVMTSEIDGHKLLFVHPTSTVVDHRMIDKWLAKTLPRTAFRDDGDINRTDAENFRDVFRVTRRQDASVSSDSVASSDLP